MMGMKTNRFISVALPILVILTLVISSSGCQPSFPTNQGPVATPSVAATPTNSLFTPINLEIPYGLISKESLFAYLEGLTSIQPYSGWRNSASSGEAEALDYVEAKLLEFSNLQDGGLELERQSFKVYLSTEIWDSDLTLTVNGQEIKAPAEALRGNRFDRSLAVYYDSDGNINDSNPDPITATGSPLVVCDEDTLYNLTTSEFKDRILFLDYALLDRVTSVASSDGSRLGAYENSNRILEMVNHGLAGVVLVTQYSNEPGESHGSFVSEGGSTFGTDLPSRRVPVLYVRIEDLSPAGIDTWEDLQQIESARITLDVDVFSPGKSGNVIARIPGADSSMAVILGAHIDSPNTPGAFDDGSGSATLLEIGRVLDTSRIQPPVDVYLAWFGSEELGLYGSSYFVSTHQELLDRTLAMLQMDGLGYPLEGKTSTITMTLASYDRFGEKRLLLPDFLSNAVAVQGISLDWYIEHGIESDNNNFEAFDVPNLNLIYLNAADFNKSGLPITYAIHMHDPYETVNRALAAGDVFVNMAKVFLAAALEIGRIQPNLRVTPAPTRRALFVASHTESHGITTLRELGSALSWEGFDVDLIPYGQAITPADLKDVGIIVLPPGLNSPGQSPEMWSESEIALLKGYVAEGGFIVVVNSAHNYASTIVLNNLNLSVRSFNALLEPMGIKFIYGGTGGDDTVLAVSEHPLMVNASYLTFQSGNAVGFRMQTGLDLARSAGNPVIGLVEYGEQGGQVLVIAELGIIHDTSGSKNMEFMKNIAQYARMR
jgi:hypothetical protein